MVHLVDSVLQYVNDRVVAAGAWLEQVRGAAGTAAGRAACYGVRLRTRSSPPLPTSSRLLCPHLSGHGVLHQPG